jgi:hypothetical protein
VIFFFGFARCVSPFSHQIWGAAAMLHENNNLILSINVMSSSIMNEETSDERRGGSICEYYALKY